MTARGMRRIVAALREVFVVTSLASIAMLAVMTLSGLVHTYSGRNAGVTVGIDCHGVGFEYRGNVGFFTDLCQ